MTRVRMALRFAFERLERLLDLAFPPAWNPLYHLGALGFFFYWIVAVSGIYLYLFFDTGVAAAYGSVEYLTHQQWYAGGVMRSLHRYASDGMVVVMVVHLFRELSLDRYRGPRWFTWVTGVPILLLVIASGITGYWLVWDKLAQYVAVVSTEWLDELPIFGQSIARNFLAPDALDDRFFTLMVFMHIVLPLLLLLVLWIHLQRVSRPQINPARGLAIGMFLTMLALSIVKPALSQGPADLGAVPTVVGLDWFYLGFYPLLERLPAPGDLGAGGRAYPDACGAALAAAAQARARRGGRPRQLQRLHPLRQRLPLQCDHHGAAHRWSAVRARGGGQPEPVRELRDLCRRVPDLDAVPARLGAGAGHRPAGALDGRAARPAGRSCCRADRGAAHHGPRLRSRRGGRRGA